MNNEDYMKKVVEEDVKCLVEAEKSYGDSWKKRGGVGAYMMLARKWDRLETALQPGNNDTPGAGYCQATISGVGDISVAPWDIFGAISSDKRPEGVIDDIRDLRRYLILVEMEMLKEQNTPRSKRPFNPDSHCGACREPLEGVTINKKNMEPYIKKVCVNKLCSNYVRTLETNQ